MDTDNTKQIIIAYHAIESAIDAMLKPIRLELGDAETVAEMPKALYDTLKSITFDCKTIQIVLEGMDIGDLEKDVDADEELAEAGETISDILFDIKPEPKQVNFHNMNDVAKAAGL